MWKKILYLFTFIGLSYGVAFLFSTPKNIKKNKVTSDKSWQKFEKEKTAIKVTKAKQEDIIDHKVPSPSRAPASVDKTRNGRVLRGVDAKEFSSPDSALVFENKVNPKWKDVLGHNLTRFQPEGTEVLIKKEKGVIYVHKGKGQFREQVLISYKLVNGNKSSYRAMVDSSNGKILYTFDRQINEDFRKRGPAGLTHPLAQ